MKSAILENFSRYLYTLKVPNTIYSYTRSYDTHQCPAKWIRLMTFAALCRCCSNSHIIIIIIYDSRTAQQSIKGECSRLMMEYNNNTVPLRNGGACSAYNYYTKMARVSQSHESCSTTTIYIRIGRNGPLLICFVSVQRDERGAVDVRSVICII